MHDRYARDEIAGDIKNVSQRIETFPATASVSLMQFSERAMTFQKAGAKSRQQENQKCFEEKSAGQRVTGEKQCAGRVEERGMPAAGRQRISCQLSSRSRVVRADVTGGGTGGSRNK
jgi:hypothetical protein